MLQRLIYCDFSGYRRTNTYECLPDKLATRCNKLMYMIIIDTEPRIIRRWIHFNPQSINEENSMGYDAFIMLCHKYGRYGIETIRVAAASLQITGKSRKYLRHDRFLYITRHADIFEELLNISIDINASSSDGYTYTMALLNHYRRIDRRCFPIILARRPALNVTDNQGNSALMLACKRKVVSISTEPALLLLEAGAKISLRNNDGQNVVDILLSHNELNNIRVLLEALFNVAIVRQLSLREEISVALLRYYSSEDSSEDSPRETDSLGETVNESHSQNSLGEPVRSCNLSEPLDLIPDDTNECFICTETLVRRWAIIPCGHTQFCRDCVSKLPTRKCPLCRTNIHAHVLLHGI